MTCVPRGIVHWVAASIGGGGSNWKEFIQAAIKAAKAAARKAWLSAQIIYRHTAAQEVAAEHIRVQVRAMGGNPENVLLEFKIDDACKSHKACVQAGHADIVYIDNQRDTIYVWEVKSSLDGESLRATQELRFYMKKLFATGRFDHVKAGFKILPGPMIAAAPGSDEIVTVTNGKGGAALQGGPST